MNKKYRATRTFILVVVFISHLQIKDFPGKETERSVSAMGLCGSYLV